MIQTSRNRVRKQLIMAFLLVFVLGIILSGCDGPKLNQVPEELAGSWSDGNYRSGFPISSITIETNGEVILDMDRTYRGSLYGGSDDAYVVHIEGGVTAVGNVTAEETEKAYHIQLKKQDENTIMVYVEANSGYIYHGPESELFTREGYSSSDVDYDSEDLSYSETTDSEAESTDPEPDSDEFIDESQDVAYEGPIKIGIINNDPNESGYRTANDKNLKATFSVENGYDAQFAYSLRNDEQQASAEKFIEDDVDYLLLSAADTEGWEPVLKHAQEAGTKVILFDRTIDADPSLYETQVVSDMDKEGQQAVEWLEEQQLSRYKIIHIQGVKGSLAQKGRSAALDEKVSSSKNWELVKQKDAWWNSEKAEKIVKSVIRSGKDFNVIYAENDNMAKGAVKALDKAGISHGVGGKVIVMGFDCNRWALEELLNGNWNYDGQCSPFQASTIEDAIKRLENGEVLEKTTILDEIGFDASTITQEDVDTYGI